METQALVPAAPQAITAQDAPPAGGSAISVFASQGNFTAAQRMARALSSSSLVPEAYRGERNLGNCLIALELSSRIGASALMVMQNLYIVQGRPSWSSSFLIATVNACGRFTPLRFEWIGEMGKPDRGCRAVAKDRATGERLEGAWITWKMAEAEKWTTRSGSKWQTMPEQMFQYRAASFWTRIYAPELALGIMTAEEARDVHGDAVPELAPLPEALRPGSASELEAVLDETADAREPGDE